MATVEEVRNKALKRLGVLGRGQTARSEDAADLDAAYIELHAYLENKNLAPWGDKTVDVPPEFVDPVVDLLANSRATEYSIPDKKYQRIIGRASIAESRMQEILQVDPQERTQMENY